MSAKTTKVQYDSERYVIKLAYLVEDPACGWKHIPENQGVLAQKRKLALPEYADQEIRVATAAVFAEDHVIKELCRLQVVLWEFDQTGIMTSASLIENIEPRGLDSGGKNSVERLASKRLSAGDLIDIMDALHISEGRLERSCNS